MNSKIANSSNSSQRIRKGVLREIEHTEKSPEDMDEFIDGENNSHNPRETFGVTCPSCGGSLRVTEGQRSIHCEYCYANLYIANPPGVKSFFLKPRITAGKAKLEALHLISKKSGGRVKAKYTSVVEHKLVHVPFWRMRGRFIGWICGEETELKRVGKSTSTPSGEISRQVLKRESTPFSKFVSKHVDWSAPACVMRHLGMQGISMKASMLEWEIFNHDFKTSMNIALPTKSAKTARRDGYQHITNLAKPSGANIRASRFHLFGSNLSIYYYPIYLLRYKFKDRVYVITIDGNNGNIIRADVPARKKINPAAFFFIPAAFALLTETYFPLLFIAAGCIYIIDQLQGNRITMPHLWLKYRLQKWFGGN